MVYASSPASSPSRSAQSDMFTMWVVSGAGGRGMGPRQGSGERGCEAALILPERTHVRAACWEGPIFGSDRVSSPLTDRQRVIVRPVPVAPLRCITGDPPPRAGGMDRGHSGRINAATQPHHPDPGLGPCPFRLLHTAPYTCWRALLSLTRRAALLRLTSGGLVGGERSGSIFRRR
jgi:hypothetical protein